MLTSNLILPSLHCHRLHHRIDSRPKSPGPGRYDYCVHCTLGYAMAFESSGGDEATADRFVQSLRSETVPVDHG